MMRPVLGAVVLALLTAGCFGGSAAEDLSLSLTTRMLDVDNDDRKDVEVVMAITDLSGEHVATPGKAEFFLQRARGDHRTQELTFDDYARIDVDMDSGSSGWRDEGGKVFVKLLEDTHFDSGYTYRFNVKYMPSGGGSIEESTQVYYQRR